MISLFHLRLLAAGLREDVAFASRLGKGRVSSERGAARCGANGAQFDRVGSVLASRSSERAHRRAKVEALRAMASLLKVVKLGVAGLIALIVIALTVFGIGIVATYETPKSFEAKHLHNARPAITDRDGDLVGAAPGFHQIGAVSDANDDEARMAALIVDDVPPVWWDVAVALEDKRFGKSGWVYGIDVLGLPSAVLHGRGGSTLAMQVVGNLSGDKARQNDDQGNRLLKLKRKLREWASVPSLVAATKADDYMWLKRLAATHLPVMNGQIGGSTVGIAGGGWVMFGKTPKELSVGEQAIFSAALKRNITIRKQADDKVRRDWEYVKQRAKLGLALAYPEGDRRRIDGTAEIDAMPDTPPLFFDDSMPLTVRAHVVHRRNVTARTVVGEAQAELADRFGLKTLADLPLRGYELTLSSMDNYHFKQQMDGIAEVLTEKLGRECRLFVPLGREGFRDSLYQRVTGKPHCAPADLPKTERAQVLAVLANEQGEIVRWYQSGSEEPIYAGVMGRTANDGRHNPDSEIRDVGSVAKIAIAVLLANEGDSPAQRYCRKSFNGRLDSDGTTGFNACNEHGAMIEAREVFARSSNLAILWRLKQLPKAKLEKLAADLGLKLPRDVEPAYALAYGQVKAAPRQIHNLIHVIGEIVLERRKDAAQPPHIVRRLDTGDGFRSLKQSDPAALRRLPGYLATDEGRQYVREVLDAVLTNAHGTMRFMRPYTPAGSNGLVSAHIGKTGTPVNQNNVVTDKFVTGSLVDDGRFYSYLLMVRAPNPGKYPLGQRLSAEHFAPLLSGLLQEIPHASAM